MNSFCYFFINGKWKEAMIKLLKYFKIRGEMLNQNLRIRDIQ